MLPREVIQNARRLEIITRQRVNEQLAGQYHSVFKGRGMDFDEVRPYSPGDEIRFIDWNVSARTGDLHIKRFVEERELTVLVVVDTSASISFGTAARTKRAVAAELAAVVAFSAIKNNDRVGLVLFGGDVERYIPPKKGKKHVMRVITDVLGHRPSERGTDVGSVLRYISRVTSRKAVIFLLSDFLASDFELDLKVAARRHDVVPMIIEDPMERTLPDAGAIVPLRDLETGARVWVDLGSRRQREAWARAAEERRERRRLLFQRLKIDAVLVDTSKPPIDPLVAFFKRRASRY